MIHGLEQPYNDVPLWKYTAALDFFGPGKNHESHLAKTPDDIERLLTSEAFGEPSCTKVSFIQSLSLYTLMSLCRSDATDFVLG
jgi:TPP-dependent 2-oxoacid decarboxylase